MASNHVFTKLGAMNIGAHEVLNLRLRSLVSKKPMSKTLLKLDLVPIPNPNTMHSGFCCCLPDQNPLNSGSQGRLAFALIRCSTVEISKT
ncbi:uncharacterized protein Pyn_13675 [Prunus yedoensis var. nudiflora]|uniref:Uncharacterized protein n=1 Tax=Prunus yedoensis var. nudiflora TaxID=2094558 RepID=A0A314ZZE0_PRUYE|nr:uncharacterized protein Pyn_13675 [Prunus yedoensis var. nudiflora]